MVLQALGMAHLNELLSFDEKTPFVFICLAHYFKKGQCGSETKNGKREFVCGCLLVCMSVYVHTHRHLEREKETGRNTK